MSGRRAREQRKSARPPTGRTRLQGAEATPLGLVSRYLTAGDLYREPAPLERVVAALMTVPAETAVAWVAAMLASSAWGKTMRDLQAEQARDWFDASTPLGRKARDLVLSGERLLLAPQVLLLMARLACIYGTPPPTAARPGAENALREAMLVLAHHLGAERREHDTAAPGGQVVVGGRDVTAFEVGLVANQLLNRAPYPMSAFDRFERRWREIPTEQPTAPQMVDLPGEYEAATGVPLADLALISVSLWSRTVTEAGPVAPPGYLDGLGLGPDRVGRAVALISDTPAGIARRSLQAARSDLDPEYDTGLFGQTPVVRLANGALVVVSPVLLLERAFGWLPSYDIRHAYEQTGGREGRKRADRALSCLRRTTEIHAVETLAAVTSTGATPGRTYGEDRIQAAYGTGRPNADAACAWPGHWIVAEVSSRQTPRTVAGATSAADLLDHLNKGTVAKALQLDATIAAIRADETPLTGRPAPTGPRRFWPVLIVPDGFPANPLTVRRLHRMIRQAGLLTDPDTAPLVVMDAEALEAVETVAAGGGPPLPALLADHARSDKADYGFKDWLLLTRGTLRPTSRITDRWARAFAPAFDALGPDPTAG